jgi:hypothetical protein
MTIKRAPGGQGWADAMFLSGASNQDYIEAMLARAQQVEKTIYVQPEQRVEAYFGSKQFLLLYDGRIVLKRSYHYVDCCRGKSPYDFHDELKRLVASLRENEP